jgi:hypothetical protein
MGGDLFSSDELFGWVEQQASFGPRRAGSEAGKKNEGFVFSRLESFGLEKVRREPVPVTYWNAERASLLVEGADISSFGIPFTAFTGPGGIRAPLALASATKEWKGRLVVADIGFPDLRAKWLKRLALGTYDLGEDWDELKHPATWIRLGWELYALAAKRGAAGFIGILRDQPGGSCRMYAPYGFREKDILDKPLAGLWVGREDGARLRQWAREGVTAHLTLTGTHVPATSHNIVGEIPGKTEEVMVLSCHHDSPFVSPVEDASGVAVVLALARYLKEKAPLQRRVVVLLTSGHFYGSLGTRTFIERHRRDLLPRTAVEISIEHMALEAVEAPNGKLVASGRPEPAAIFMPFNRGLRDLLLRKLAEHGLSRTLLLPPEGPLGNYPPTDGGDWYEAGIPVLNYISNPVYLLTEDDALSWVDRERLSAAARFFADVIETCDGLPREAFGNRDFLPRRGLMKLLSRLVSRAK